MRFLTAADVEAALQPLPLVEALSAAFAAGVEAPTRHHHAMRRDGLADATLLLMPAWQRHPGGFAGIKIVSVVPDNPARALPTVIGSYLLMSAATGEPLALIDGVSLTQRRTAAASALAVRHLARTDARHLVMVGAGALAPHLIAAHAAVRPIDRVTIWSRDPENARHLAERVRRPGLATAATADLDAAVAEADIVSAATLAATPLIHGAALPEGCHVDLVGGFLPTMREADDAAIVRSRVFVDTEAALVEAGDLTQPLASGALRREAVVADLAALCRGENAGRVSAGEITLFKSVGAAIEDLAAAILVHDRAAR